MGSPQRRRFGRPFWPSRLRLLDAKAEIVYVGTTPGSWPEFSKRMFGLAVSAAVISAVAMFFVWGDSILKILKENNPTFRYVSPAPGYERQTI
jgi:hypothetical protein